MRRAHIGRYGLVSTGALDGVDLDANGDGKIRSAELDAFADALEAAGVSSAVSGEVRQMIEDGVFDMTTLQRSKVFFEVVAILATIGFFVAPTGSLTAAGFLVLEIGATSTLVYINVNEGNYGEALIEAIGVGFGLSEARAAKNVFKGAFARRAAAISGRTPNRLDHLAVDDLATLMTQQGRLADWASGASVPPAELPTYVDAGLPVGERAAAFVTASSRLGDEFVAEADRLGLPLLEANDLMVAARSAARRQVADADPVAAARIDEFEEVFAVACRTRSFAGDTLVALADGSLAPIAEVQVGDEVLAYEFDTGETVAREVTATLPHTDWLLDAHFSDGSVMSVTEDHRFWSVTDDAWVELQDLDTTDVLLTPDGATVSVDWLDWDAGVTTDAYDLTIDQEHNFFVAADGSAEPLLVHNANIVGFGCGDRISGAALDAINRLSESDRLTDEVAEQLLGIRSRTTREGIAEALAAAGDDLDLAERIATNAAANVATTGAIVRTTSPNRTAAILSSRSELFADVVSPGRRDAVQAILRSVSANDLDEGVDELFELVFNSDRGAAAADWLQTRPGQIDDFVNGGTKSNSGVLPTEEETGAWYEATVKFPNAEGFDYADRLADDLVWDPSDTQGVWRSRTSPTSEAVTDARRSLSGLVTSMPRLSQAEVLRNVNPPRPSSFSELNNNQLGQGVEAARVIQLRNAAPNEVVAQARLRVTLNSGETIVTVADALTDPVLNGNVLKLLFREMKASTVRAPTASALRANQALTADGLLNNPANIVSIEVLSGDGLDDLLGEFPDVAAVTVDRFVLESFSF